MAKVSIVRCKEYELKQVESAIRKSLKLINFEIPKNKKILLKPNVLGHFGGSKSQAITTHPIIIKALANIFHRNKLFLGDSSGQPDTDKALQETHLKETAESSGIKVINFDRAPKVLVNFHGEHLRHQYIAKIVKEADLIINIPKLKTHSLTLYTGAIKNLFGIIPGSRKSQLHYITKTEQKFSEMLIDILKTINPKLTIMDAIVGMDGNGPSMGSPHHSGIILASENPSALDVTALKLISFNPNDITAIKLAKKEKLFGKIEILGDKKTKFKYKKPSSKLILKFIPSFIKNKLFEKKFQVDTKKCKRCGVCSKVCPVKAITYNPYPIWNFKKCIRCHCCFESCPYNAIEIKDNIIYTLYIYIGNKIRKK